jgi:hypothetical protein
MDRAEMRMVHLTITPRPFGASSANRRSRFEISARAWAPLDAVHLTVILSNATVSSFLRGFAASSRIVGLPHAAHLHSRKRCSIRAAFLTAGRLPPTASALTPASFDRRHREAIRFHGQACHGDLSRPMMAPDRIHVRCLVLHPSSKQTKGAPSVCGQIGPNH